MSKKETYYSRNKEQVNARQKLWLKTDEGRESRRQTERRWRLGHPEHHLHKLAKARAKRSGVEFDIDIEDVVIPTRCPILDIELYPGVGKRSDNSPSLDRIDNSRGYVKGNVAVISWKANNLKKDLTEQHLELLLRYVKGELYES